MPTPYTPRRSDRSITATCCEAAQLVLASWLSIRLSAISIDLLCDLAGRGERSPVTPREALWLHACLATIIEGEAALGREARP